MNDFLGNFKTIKCNFSCNGPFCYFFHSVYDYRRAPGSYYPVLCPDAIANEFCIHENCRFCMNYTEFLYHPANYKRKLCLSEAMKLDCKYGAFCPYQHTERQPKPPAEVAIKQPELELKPKTPPDLEKPKPEASNKLAEDQNVLNIPEFIPEKLYILGEEIKKYEDRFNEFKQCKGQFDISYAVQMIATYVSAFLNTEGGTIYYGIRDNGTISGVKLIRRTRDLFTQSLDSLLNKFRPPVGPDKYSLSFVSVYDNKKILINDLYIMEIEIKRGDPSKIYFTHKEEAFVKRDSSVSQLKGIALIDFSRNRNI